MKNLLMIVPSLMLAASVSQAYCQPQDPAALRIELDSYPDSELSPATKAYEIEQDRRAHVSEVIACLAARENIPAYHANLAIETLLKERDEKIQVLRQQASQMAQRLQDPNLSPELKSLYTDSLNFLPQKIQDLMDSTGRMVAKINRYTK